MNNTLRVGLLGSGFIARWLSQSCDEGST